jgi:hypothetical protein
MPVKNKNAGFPFLFGNPALKQQKVFYAKPTLFYSE